MKHLCCAVLCAVPLCLSLSAAEPKELTKGHDALVYSVAFSPDGKVLASAGFVSAPNTTFRYSHSA